MKNDLSNLVELKLPKEFPLSQDQVQLLFVLFKQALLSPRMKVFRLSGGKLPQRMSPGAAGYDVFARAIVSPKKNEHDPRNRKLRRILFDFRNGPRSKKVDLRVKEHVKKVNKEDGSGKEWVYVLYPGESILVDVGFAAEMPEELFFWTAPRSGLASLFQITITNAPGTVDCDYRGSAGILMHNRGKEVFYIRPKMRVAQILFSLVITPEMIPVRYFKQLSRTHRSGSGFGSTGNGLVNQLDKPKKVKKKITKRKKQKTTA